MSNFILFDETMSPYEKMYFVLILTLFIMIYFLVKQLLDWLIIQKYTHLISYIMSSMFYLNIFLIILLIVNSGDMPRMFISYVIQTATIFGILLAVTLSAISIYRKITAKKA